jgi:hypothetical protein
MTTFKATNTVKRFPGKYGWYYVELEESLAKDLRPILKDIWPVLLKSEFKINNTVWKRSVMPIKDGPLFIALPAKIRKSEKITEGQKISVSFQLQV